MIFFPLHLGQGIHKVILILVPLSLMAAKGFVLGWHCWCLSSNLLNDNLLPNVLWCMLCPCLLISFKTSLMRTEVLRIQSLQIVIFSYLGFSWLLIKIWHFLLLQVIDILDCNAWRVIQIPATPIQNTKCSDTASRHYTSHAWCIVSQLYQKFCESWCFLFLKYVLSWCFFFSKYIIENRFQIPTLYDTGKDWYV